VFNYRKSDIEKVARELWGREELLTRHMDPFVSVFVQATFMRSRKPCIFVTNRKILLKNRLWLESNFQGINLNIMSIEEASLFVDLFLKQRNEFHTAPGVVTSRWFWYLMSARVKIPHFHVGDGIIDAMISRLSYALMASDEIGKQFYQGADNNTIDLIIYHFNYLISLLSGVFDNLAIKTNSQLGLGFSTGPDISLSPKRGGEFLKALRDKDTVLRQHITKYNPLISLVYKFREHIIHREGTKKCIFCSMSRNDRWTAGVINVDATTVQLITACGDTGVSYDSYSKWGVLSSSGDHHIEPFNFTTQLLRHIFIFADGYLKLLGFTEVSDKSFTGADEFLKKKRAFEDCYLGL